MHVQVSPSRACAEQDVARCKSDIRSECDSSPWQQSTPIGREKDGAIFVRNQFRLQAFNGAPQITVRQTDAQAFERPKQLSAGLQDP